VFESSVVAIKITSHDPTNLIVVQYFCRVHNCQSVKFPSYSISYSQVCGRVTGYQYGTPDTRHPQNPNNNLNEAYIDGVSLTRGKPRQHI